jgi:N-acetylneuraminic acid mutarotase
MRKALIFILLFFCSLFNFAQDWTWMKGQKTVNNYGGYGTISVPTPTNRPGSRHGGATWTDASGNLWYFGGEGFATGGPIGWLSDIWKYSISSNQWTWINGPNVTNQPGIYGTKGVGSSTNCPGAREFMAYWTDAAGKFWMFGGSGFDAAGNFGNLNDLWKYDPLTNEWTWMHGTGNINVNGIYGTLNVPSPTNAPGARWGAVQWIDNSNNLWLFSGSGFPATGLDGDLNDLWKYNIGTNQWTWVKGSSVINQNGVYGVKGIGNPSNKPGGREQSSAVYSASGEVFIFGGRGFPETGTIGILNDTWKYDPVNNEFTWENGAKVISSNGSYGTSCVPSPTNTPGSRYTQVYWKDAAGNFWLFGGLGFAATAGVGRLNDLWKFNTSTKEWMWVDGSNASNAQGVYGFLTVTSSTNTPGARNYSNGWIDNGGSFWLFGGFGYPEVGGIGNLNDLWRYDLGCAPVDSTVNDDLSICSGNSTTLSAFSTQGNLNWYSSPTSTTVLFTGNNYVTPTFTTGASTSTYTLYVEAPTCTLVPVRTAITVTVYPLPTLSVSSSNSLICAGQTSTLNVSGALSYTWSTSSSNSGIAVSPGVTTTYTVSGADANGCESSDTITQYVSNCAGIHELLSEKDALVFPNPSDGVITVICKEQGSLELYNVTGQKVLRREINKQMTTIDLNALPAGMYIYQIRKGDWLKSGRLILNH